MPSNLGDIDSPKLKSLTYLFYAYFISGFYYGFLALLAAYKYGDNGFTLVIYGDANVFFFRSDPVGELSILGEADLSCMSLISYSVLGERLL